MFEARFLAAAYRLFTLVLPGVLLLLTACGGSSTAAPPAPTPDITGNWAIAGSPSAPAQSLELSGNLTGSGKQITGTFLALGSSCFLPSPVFSGTLPVPLLTFTGTLDASGRLRLVSSAYQNQVVTATGTISADGNTLTQGTYSIAGGCADKMTGALAGYRIPPLTGTFSGSFTLSNLTTPGSTAISVTAQLTQAATPTGFAYPLSGSVTITGTPCFSKGNTIAATPANPLAGGLVFGKHYVVLFAMDDGSTVGATGDSDLAAAQLRTIFSVSGGKCSGDFGNGTLARQ